MESRHIAGLCGVLLALVVAAVLHHPREPLRPGMSPSEKREYMKRNTMIGRLIAWFEQVTKKQ